MAAQFGREAASLRRATGRQVPFRGSTMCTRAASTSVLRTIQQDVATKQRSAVEVATAYLQQLKSVEGQIKSFLTVDEDHVLAQAAAVDERIAKGETAGPLAGVPIGVKDNLCTKGLLTTAASKVLQGYVPPYNATAVEKLVAAGAVVIGKTNMDEFGMGSTTENSGYQVTANPWDTSRVPGGSSGGSAAAVAAGQCAAALGSDTGGSIRMPAHYCGVVGLKPSYGRVSRYGLIAYASSLDVVGPMTRSVEDAARMLQIMAGGDSSDATCSAEPVANYLSGLLPAEQLSSAPLKGKMIGVIRETLGEGVSEGVNAAVQQAAKQLEQLGATVEEVSLPSTNVGLPAYYVLATSEASSNLARYDGVRYGLRRDSEELRGMYDGSRAAGLGQEVKRRILMGTYALSAGYYDAFYKRAQQVRTLVQEEMLSALQKYDCLISPAAPTAAFPIGGKVADPLSMYKEDLMTVSLNLAGLPAVVVPCGFDSNAGAQGPLPVGLQVIGRMFGEAELLALAHVLEVAGGAGAGAAAGAPARPAVCAA